MAKFANIIAGGAMIVAGGILAMTGIGAALAPWLITTGAGVLMGGVGTLLTSRKPLGGFASTVRNPIAPWKIIYGRARTGGTMVYFHSWGDNNKMVDMVIVLAAHACEAIDAVYFDQNRLVFDTDAKPAGAHASAGTSIAPVQQKINIASIARANGVVTVQLNSALNRIMEGDQVKVSGVTTDATLNGTFPIAQILQQGPSSIRFTFLNGGGDVTIAGQGRVETQWADYGRKVYFEPLLGDQVLGETFAGMSGTPYDGDRGNYVNPDDVEGLGGDTEDQPNPWTAYHSLQGKTAVFLRLHYNEKYFAGGLPQISFLVRGKNDILDPREGPEARGYTENAALCIADFLANPTWGFRAQYGTEIPTDELIAAANICDEEVPLAISTESLTVTEPAYACNGQFDLTSRRGEILQNLLTSCGGRLLYIGGKYTIWPAAWYGNSFAIGSSPGGGVTALPAFEKIAAGPIEWRPALGVRELYNGAKGTYISPANRWQPSDIPAYAQDTRHGYDSPGDPEDDANMAADGGDRRWLDVQLPFTISPSAAQRLLKIELLRRRQQGAGRLSMNMTAYPIAPLDNILLTFGAMNWTEKQLEVQNTRFRMDGDENGNALGLVVDVDVQETDPAIYEWSTAEELSPQGYVQPEIPGVGSLGFFSKGETPGFQVPYPWKPGYLKPLVGDAMYPGPVVGGENKGRGTFGLSVRYGYDAQGNATANMDFVGITPATRLSSITPPEVECVAGTSGNLKAGTYVIAASAFDAGSPVKPSRLSVPVEITIPESDDGVGSIAVTVHWPPDSNGGEVFMADDDEERGFHLQAALTSAEMSLSITDFDRSTRGAPDSTFDHVSVQPIKVAHSGDFAAQVQSCTADTITLGGAGMTVNLWAGHVLSLLGKLDSSEPLIELNMRVVSNTASEDGLFTVTIGPNANGDQLPDLTELLVTGDLLVMRMNATFTPTSFADPNIANPYYPDGATGFEAGRKAMMVTGPNAGDVQTIVGVEEDGGGKKTIYRLAAQWKVTPNAGDIVIVLDADGGLETHGQPVPAAAEVASPVASPLVTNLAAQTWLFIARAHNAAHRNVADRWAQVREIYVFGSQGTRTIRESQDMKPTDALIDADASAGAIVYTLLPFAEIPNRLIFVQKIDGSTNPVTVQCQGGDSINGEGSVVLEAEWSQVWVKVSGNG